MHPLPLGLGRKSMLLPCARAGPAHLCAEHGVQGGGEGAGSASLWYCLVLKGKLSVAGTGSSKSSPWWFRYNQNCRVGFCGISIIPSYLVASSFQTRSTAWLPWRKDAPFSLDQRLLPPCVSVLFRKYPSMPCVLLLKRPKFRGTTWDTCRCSPEQ